MLSCFLLLLLFCFVLTTDKMSEGTSTVHQFLEPQPYDPLKHRKIEHGNGIIGSMMHLIKCSIGAGILSMPRAFNQSGIWFGVFGTIVMGLLCIHCCYIIASVSRRQCVISRLPLLSYGDTAQYTLLNGPPMLRKFSNCAKHFVNISLWCTYYGLCSVYVVYVASQTKQLVECTGKEAPENQWRVGLYMLCYFPVFLLLGQFRYLQQIVPLSTVANFLYLLGFGVIFYYIFRTPMPDIGSRPAIGDFESILSFMAIVIFAMENVGVIMPLENTQKHPEKFLGCGVLVTTMSLTTGIYLFVGFFGYWKYGAEVDDSIALTPPAEDTAAILMKCSFMVAVLLGYGLSFFIPSSIIWELVKDPMKQRFSATKIFLWETVFRSGIVTVTVIMASLVPKISAIIGLVGAIFFSTAGILCPIFLETITYWTEGGPCGFFRKLKNVIIFAVYVAVLVVGTYESIGDLLQFDAQNSLCQ